MRRRIQYNELHPQMSVQLYEEEDTHLFIRGGHMRRIHACHMRRSYEEEDTRQRAAPANVGTVK